MLAAMTQPQTSCVDARLDAVFAALADPTRRAILRTLLEAPRSVGALAVPHAMSLAAVSKHVAILARVGLVSRSRAGRVTTCRLEPDALETAVVWMQGFGSFDAADYDALERLVEAALGSGDGLDHPLGPGEID